MSLGEEEEKKKKDQMQSQMKSNSKYTIRLNSFTPLEKEWMRLLTYFDTTLGKITNFKSGVKPLGHRKQVIIKV